MDKSDMIAYTEVDKILDLMDEQFQQKIPSKLRKLISENKLSDYNVTINPNIPLKQQKISRKALTILAVLNYNYWCVEESDKRELIEKYKQNDKDKQEKLREQYNPDLLFKSKTKEPNTQVEDKQLIVYNKKQGLLSKMMGMIRKVLQIDKLFKK